VALTSPLDLRNHAPFRFNIKSTQCNYFVLSGFFTRKLDACLRMAKARAMVQVMDGRQLESFQHSGVAT